MAKPPVSLWRSAFLILGSWSIAGTVSVQLPASSVTDAASNASTASNSAGSIYDVTPPSCTVTGGPTGWINSASTSMTFSCADDRSLASAQCRLDSGSWASCSSGTTHSLSGLSQGPHTFEVRGVDSAANVGSAASRAFSVDTVLPSLSITGQSVGTSSPSFDFSATDGDSGVASYSCQLDGVESWTTCTSGKSYSGIGSGTKIFRVVAYDVAGNASTAATYSWANGGWTAYGSWYDTSTCTVSCGGGTKNQRQDRTCTNPAESNGGMTCVGSDFATQSIACNTLTVKVWGGGGGGARCISPGGGGTGGSGGASSWNGVTGGGGSGGSMYWFDDGDPDPGDCWPNSGSGNGGTASGGTTNTTGGAGTTGSTGAGGSTPNSPGGNVGRGGGGGYSTRTYSAGQLSVGASIPVTVGGGGGGAGSVGGSAGYAGMVRITWN